MNVCFWCKRPKDKDDTEGQPEYFDYELCLSCEVHHGKGIMVVQVVEEPNGNKPIGDGIYPTGKWVVVDKDRIKEVFQDYAGLKDILDTGNMFMNEETWKKFKLPN